MNFLLDKFIRDVPNFPSKGILFKDITPLLLAPGKIQETVLLIEEQWKHHTFNKIVCVEARGFIIGAALAAHTQKGLVPVRKKGKLPYKTIQATYQLEYGTDVLEMHVDAIEKGDKILLHDDVLATGGTALAAAKLIEKLGGEVVGMSFLIELLFLKGKEKSFQYNVKSLLQY